jgi:hypothetical protein
LVIAFKFIDPNLLSPTLQWITQIYYAKVIEK